MRNILKRSVFGGAVLALVLSSAGCGTNPINQDIGSFVGAITGAGVGSLIGGGRGNTIATVIGGIAGYVIGGNIGRNMDRADQERAGRLAHRGFEQPQPGVYNDTWQSQSGAPVQSRVVTQPYYQDNGRQCRPFTQETVIRIQGQPQTAVQNGTACFEYSSQYPQGMWVVHP
jgi:surface antigen